MENCALANCACECHKKAPEPAPVPVSEKVKKPRKKREGPPSEKQLTAQAAFREKVARAREIKAANPEAQLAAYQKKVMALSGEAGAQFAKDFGRFAAAGLPEEACKQIEILGLEYPLANNMDILACAQAQAGVAIHVPGGSAKVPSAEKYAKYKRSYKKRKAAKKQIFSIKYIQ